MLIELRRIPGSKCETWDAASKTAIDAEAS